MATQFIDRKESRTANSGFKKLAVQWLNEVQFSNQIFVQADSFVLRNRQLLKPANRYTSTKVPSQFPSFIFSNNRSTVLGYTGSPSSNV